MTLYYSDNQLLTKA